MDELIAQAERVARYDVRIDPRKVLKECAAALLASAERERELREALKPFANAADQLDKEMWDEGSIEGSLAYVTGSHCRAARAALKEEKP